MSYSLIPSFSATLLWKTEHTSHPFISVTVSITFSISSVLSSPFRFDRDMWPTVLIPLKRIQYDSFNEKKRYKTLESIIPAKKSHKAQGYIILNHSIFAFLGIAELIEEIRAAFEIISCC